MKKFHNLSNDYLFKNVFYNHHYLSMLLQDLFQFNIKDYDYTSPVLPKENYHKADAECDLVLANKSNIIAVEMQNQKVGSLENRTLIYASKLYGRQLQKGDFRYEKLKPITIIWLLNYRYGEEETQEYQILEKKLHKRFGNNLSIKVCNIKKLTKKEYKLLFNAKNLEQLVPLKQNPKLKPLIDLIITYNLDKEEYERMEVSNFMWSFDDEQTFRRMETYREDMEKSEKRGEKRGQKIGLQQGKLETACNLLSKGIPIELIMEATSLSKNEIQKYHKVRT